MRVHSINMSPPATPPTASAPSAPARFDTAPGLDGRARLGVALGVAVLHAVAIWAVVRAFGGLPAVLREAGLESVVAAYDVPLDNPPPSATATTTEPEGAEGASGRKAKPREIVAAPARIPNTAPPAAPAASTGNDTRSGATAAGAGTGGGTAGGGTGSGGNGDGAGGRFVAQKAVKIAGDITSTRDYPAASRASRLGTSVIVALVVGTDGRVKGCTVRKRSGDPEADGITCRLAIDRFRFRPALDQNGDPLESVYGWEQRFFAP